MAETTMDKLVSLLRDVDSSTVERDLWGLSGAWDTDRSEYS